MPQQLVEPTIDVVADRGGRSRILNATSGSPASASATAVSAAIASEHGAELIVVHVRAPAVMRVGRLAPTIVHNQRLRDPHASTVLAAARQAAWANGAFARVVLMSGEPAPAILSVAAELAVDLIVIGARPSHAPVVLAAPTRYRIQRDARCPVRVVPLIVPAPPNVSLRTLPTT